MPLFGERRAGGSATARRVALPPYEFRARTAGRGTPVVLLHGLSGSARWWDRNLDALAARHEVTAVDLPGFGGSRRFVGSPLPLPFDESVSLLARWLADDFPEPVHLVGHSMGGQLAIEVAARAPERVRSITLVAATGVPFELRARPRLRALLRPLPPGVVSFGPRLAIDAFRAGPGSIALASMHLLARDSRDAMRSVRAPALLVWGDSDPLVPLEYADAIHELIPHGRLEVLERAGHIPMWDAPGDFNRRALDFFREVEEGRVTAGARREERAPVFAWAIEGIDEGICWRSSRARPGVVLVHGLGIGTRYFRRFAESLHELGIGAAAPDLPGVGFSEEAEPLDHENVARALLAWAGSAGLGDALWIGHSTGCQVVEAVRRLSAVPPRAVYISPVWTRRRWPWVRLPALLALDGLREPWGLIAEAARAYWEAGAVRIVRLAAAARRDLEASVIAPQQTLAVTGARDKLVDRSRLAEMGVRMREIDGGHGIVWSNPGEIARAVRELM